MDITFHTKGQGKKAVEPEALPLEQILALAADLTKDSSPDQIKTVLGKAAKASLGPIARQKAIGAIADRTGVPVNVLKQELALFELKVGADSNDKARVLANAVLANSFNDGKHLLRCADGSYWGIRHRPLHSGSAAGSRSGSGENRSSASSEAIVFVVCSNTNATCRLQHFVVPDAEG